VHGKCSSTLKNFISERDGGAKYTLTFIYTLDVTVERLCIVYDFISTDITFLAKTILAMTYGVTHVGT
jgi:hypothetical protein